MPLCFAVFASHKTSVYQGEEVADTDGSSESIPTLSPDHTTGTASNAGNYAFSTARNAKMCYLYARFIHISSSIPQINLYTSKALLYANLSKEQADSALSQLGDDEKYAVRYLNRSVAYIEQSILILKQIRESDHLQTIRELGNQSAIQAANAVIAAYNASLYTTDELEIAQTKTDAKKINKLEQLPKELAEIKLQPEKNVLLKETAGTEAQSGNSSLARKEPDALSFPTDVHKKEDERKVSRNDTHIVQTSEKKLSTYVHLGALIIALGFMSFISFAGSATASVTSISTASDITGNPEISHLIKSHIPFQEHVYIGQNHHIPLSVRQNGIRAFISAGKVNDIPHINRYFSDVYKSLPAGGIMIGCVVSLSSRRKAITARWMPGLAHLILAADFIVNRVLPKLPFTSGIYAYCTGGRRPVISLSETLGRLVCCGFRIEDEKLVDGINYFVCSKNGKPVVEKNTSNGILLKTKRIGRYGNLITVYKIRTMRPYSEYLQDYVYKKNKLTNGGKFRDDFRITGWGKFLRTFWIDEWPMLINLCKGEVKLIGVRPLSPHFMSLYSEQLQQYRIRFKPGLIPPFYADLPNTLEDIMESERRYLQAYEKEPFKTDVKYFFRACYNILFKHARSH